MEETYRLLSQINKEKLKQEKIEKSTLDYKATMFYVNFCCWCNAYEYDKTDYKNLKIFVEKNPNYNTCFWVKKKALEKFFNFKYVFDYNLKKWVVV